MGSAYDTPFWSKGFYDHKARWIHYFNQIRTVAAELRGCAGKLDSFSLLEVGPSMGLVTNYLRKYGVNVTTLDVKQEYSPDVIGSVTEMPFPGNSFDMILVCEVLEHLPFEEFTKALKELNRVTRKKVFLSLPDGRKTIFGCAYKLPFLKERRLLLKAPSFKRHKFNGHFWEIGKRGYSLSRILRLIRDSRFCILREWVVYDTPKNHYFLLQKLESKLTLN